MKKLLLSLLLALPSASVFSQANTTELFLVNLELKNDKLICGTPVNITNHKGYDNQPHFSFDSKRIMYVSMPDTLQSDIFEYVISDSTTKQLTKTPESEYSPVFSPEQDMVSFVRVDADKGQRLYQATLQFSDAYDLIFGLDSIGYYSWLNDSTIALACLNNVMELFIYEINSGQFIVPDRAIGRCMMKMPGTSDLVYTKKTDDKVTLYRYTTGDETIAVFCEGLGDVEDYAFTPDGRLLAGQNGKLFSCQPGKDPEWSEIADFTKSSGAFYRMAVSPDGKRLALVGYTGKRP